MLPKNARLSRAEFSAIFARPQKRTYFPFCTVYFADVPQFQASVVAGKKVAKHAVRRNQLRREVYGAIQAKLTECVTPPRGAYIFILKPGMASLSKVKRHATIADFLAQSINSR